MYTRLQRTDFYSPVSFLFFNIGSPLDTTYTSITYPRLVQTSFLAAGQQRSSLQRTAARPNRPRQRGPSVSMNALATDSLTPSHTPSCSLPGRWGSRTAATE